LTDKKPILKFNKLWSKLTDEVLKDNDDRFVVIRDISAARFYPGKTDIEVQVNGERIFDVRLKAKKPVKRLDLTDDMTLADSRMFVRKFRMMRPNIDEFIYMEFKRIGESDEN